MGKMVQGRTGEAAVGKRVQGRTGGGNNGEEEYVVVKGEFIGYFLFVF